MNIIRRFFGCTILENQQIFIAGGRTSVISEPIDICEVYDRNEDEWKLVPNKMNYPRFGLCCVSLLNGRVLIIGGFDGSDVQSSVEFFNPWDNTFQLAPSMNEKRFSCACVLLQNGHVLVTGGHDGLNEDEFSSCEKFDPENNTWIFVNSMQGRRRNHSLALTANGEVLCVGGFNSLVGFMQSCEKYNPKEDKWRFVSNLISARGGHGSCQIHLNI
jgi:N-acetylneuraminic acid mutarotase